MNGLRALTLKYFFKQKFEEIKEHLDVVIAITFFIGIILMSFGGSYERFFIIFYIGIGIIIFWFLVLIITLLNTFIKWLMSNWKKAKRRAIKDIKNGHK